MTAKTNRYIETTDQAGRPFAILRGTPVAVISVHRSQSGAGVPQASATVTANGWTLGLPADPANEAHTCSVPLDALDFGT